jgi:hypothetical protein
MCGWPPTCKSYFREKHWSLTVMCPAFRCGRAARSCQHTQNVERPLQPAAPADVLSSHPCYAAAMIHDLITAIMVTSAAVLASELLGRVWEFF